MFCTLFGHSFYSSNRKLMARHIKSNFCAPGEYLVHRGDALSNIYLVCNGSMEVLQSGMVVAILGKGDLVGCDIPASLAAEALIKSSSDVRALTYCDLKSIHIPGLLEVLKLYPEFAETFCTEIIHDLTFNLRDGYENEGGLHPAHSLTLPSISEDDEENEDDDESGSDKSPPSSPGLGAVTRRAKTEEWEAPLRAPPARLSDMPVYGQNRRHPPTLRFCQMKSSPVFGRTVGAEQSDLRDEVEATRTNVDHLDAQLTSLTRDVNKLGTELRLALSLLHQLVGNQKVQQDKPTTRSCEEVSATKTSCKLVIAEQQKGSSQSINVATIDHGHTKRSLQTQTERFLLDDLLSKLVDSGSPPPNSGYSSSSSNEERVRYLIGVHGQRTEDSESISEDSVLKNSLTIQSMTSSRDVSPFKGSRNSWNTLSAPFCEPQASPLPSPRPAVTTATTTADTTTTAAATQISIDIDLPATTSTATTTTVTTAARQRKGSTEL